MTWSFHVKNGDLNFAGPGGFATVTGQQKLVQDLKNWLLEPRGTDPFHPDYGSVLDGGVMPDGREVVSTIGSTIDGEAQLNIEAEVRRILTSYQQIQLDRINRESVVYGGKNTFSNGEILASIQDVVITHYGDTIMAQCVIRTGSGDAISFVQPLT